MARIRSIKPKFFRHEGLQDLEIARPGKYVMLVFAGLWGHCDREGRFEWTPRSLKLDILPFLPFDMSETLGLLQEGGFVRRYEINGRVYGWIPSFKEHQRITGKESTDSKILPAPPGQQEGNSGETVEQRAGGQEEEQEGNKEQEQEEERRDVSSFISSIAQKTKMPSGNTNFSDRAVKKARWEQKIMDEFRRTHTPERAEKIIGAYTNGEKWAKDEFERMDKRIKSLSQRVA